MRQVSEAAPRAATKASIDFLDLVTFGIQRHAEADRLGQKFIFVSEIHEGADRMSSRIEQFRSLTQFSVGIARDNNRACVLLERDGAGWRVADFAHCAADDLDGVHAFLRDATSQQCAGG